ncbi:hypothetical protein JCM16303_003496 [Sporobolomyces ruberrimus]
MSSDSTTSEPAHLPPPIPSVNPNPVPVPVIKKANKPFLVHQKYKRQQAKLAPSSNSPATPSFLFDAVKWTLIAFMTSIVLSRAITQTWTWGYEPTFSPLEYLQSILVPPPGPLTLTEIQLSLYDGKTDPSLPIYLAIDGDVYDVTKGSESYGPGGAYNHFAGVDAARAFVTGCFKTHLTHDLRGFDEKELATLKYWKEFYETHAKYRKVGRVMHPPIDPNSPIPEPCTQGNGKMGQKPSS